MSFNPETGRPYNFFEYPAEPRLSVYRRGIDAVEASDPYAGLLCSLHYESFVRNATGAADRNSPIFDPVSWRAGTTWDVTPGLTLYAQYTTATSPVSSILLASVANSRFRLTKGRAYEAGFKASGWGGRAC